MKPEPPHNDKSVNMRLADAFEKVAEEKEELTKLTQQAQTEGWSMTKLIEARRHHQDRILDLEISIKILMIRIANADYAKAPDEN